MSRTQHYGYEEEHLVVFRETFTGNGAATTFQLTGNIGNATFETGGWAVANVEISMAADVTKTTRATLYDSTNILTRNKITVSSISAGGLVTLDHAPLAENFYIWYWYDLEGDALQDYYREDYVNSMESDAGVSTAAGVAVNTAGFNNNLSAADDTVQKALDTLDNLTVASPWTQGTGVVYLTTSSDKVGVGTAAPNTNRFEIGDSGTSATVLCKITADDGTPYALMIGNDTYSTTDTLGLGMYLDNSGDAIIINNGAGYVQIVSKGTADTSDLYLDVEDEIYFRDYASGTPVTRAQLTVTETTGTVLALGVDNTVRGAIRVYGHATGTADGGNIYIYTADDHDTTTDYWGLWAYEDDLWIGPSPDNDVIVITAEKDLKVTSGTICLADLTDGYVPYHVSDAAGLANGPIFVTSGGNVGFNTTDIEAWDSNYRAIQLGTTPAIMYGEGNLWMMRNAYYDGTWKYRTASTAQSVNLDGSGNINFQVAGSGTADGALTWTTAVYVSAAGELTTVGGVSLANNTKLYFRSSTPTDMYMFCDSSFNFQMRNETANKNFSMMIQEGGAFTINLIPTSGSPAVDNEKFRVTRTYANINTPLNVTGITKNTTLLSLNSAQWTAGGDYVDFLVTDPTLDTVGQFRWLADAVAYSSALAIYVNPGGGAHTVALERVRLDYAGNVGISTTAPVCRLEVEDAATAASMLVKITQDNADVYGLVIGNDTYSTTDTNGLRFKVTDAGVAVIDWTGASLNLGSGAAGVDYILTFDGETNDGTITWMEDENWFKFNRPIRMATSLYRRYYHIALASANPGASGATWVNPGANSTGGWRLDAASETLHGSTDVHDDWDGASDLKAEVRFYVNVDNTGGGAGDTVDIKIVFYYKGVGDTVTKTQTVEVATVVGASAQYKAFKADFTVDWDATSNVVEAGDVIGMLVNLETDTSEVDDIVVTGISFSYKSTHIGIEDGDE